jgi:predicted nucleotidyltransferase
MFRRFVFRAYTGYRGNGTLSQSAMDNEALYKEIVDRIVPLAKPYKIIIFGSRARGDAGARSDVDVLLVQPSTLPRHRRAGPLYAALADLPVEVDVLVYTPDEVLEWQDVPQAFVTTACREGMVIYEKPA